MDKPKSKQLEDDVMQALESLRAILDKNDDGPNIDEMAPPSDQDIPTLNTVVVRPKQETSMQAMSLFDDPVEPTEPKTKAKPAKKPTKKAEEQLILPQVSELDKHHGVEAAPTAKAASSVNFDDYWALLEPKLKQAAKDCFDELFNAAKLNANNKD